MGDFEQFAEGKDDTDRKKALMELVKAVKDVLVPYSMTTRLKVWEKLSGKKGSEEMQALLKSPSRNMNKFRTLIP